MLEARPTPDRVLRVFSSSLVAFNLVLQAGDWVTSWVGYYRGAQETNPVTLWLIKAVGNDYIGISIEKVAYIAMFIGICLLMRALLKVKGTITKYGGLICLGAFLIFCIIEFAIVVSANMAALGF